MKDLLIVVDMVNGFVNCGALADEKINKITPNIEKLIKKAKQKEMEIIAFRDCHSENDEEFKIFPKHCVKGTEESELIPELKKYEKDMILIDKNTTNGFNTELFKVIAKKSSFQNVYVVGCCTDICVQSFVVSYLDFLNKHNIPTNVIVFEDACYTFNGPNHNAEEVHKKSIKHMENMGAKIKTVIKKENNQNF